MAERSGGRGGGLLEREGNCSTGLYVYCIILLIIVLSLWYLLE